MNAFKILFILKISVTLLVVLFRLLSKSDSTDDKLFTGEMHDEEQFRNEHFLDQSTDHLIWFAQVLFILKPTHNSFI